MNNAQSQKVLIKVLIELFCDFSKIVEILEVLVIIPLPPRCSDHPLSIDICIVLVMDNGLLYAKCVERKGINHIDPIKWIIGCFFSESFW